MKTLLMLSMLIASPVFGKEILISFDGSAKLEMWKDTLEFAEANKDTGLVYTYLVSAPYFISESQEKEHPYWAIKEMGIPYVKFRPDSASGGTKKRWNYMIQASKEGHEIGSHLCGHYDGLNWTYEQWMKEFAYFKWAMAQNPEFDSTQIKTVRAPYLSTNVGYFKALQDTGYLYDTSNVYDKKTSYTTGKETPIRQILVDDGSNRHTLPFDCNFILYPTPPGRTREEVYFDSLCYDYEHNPMPTQICLHFELMADGAYYAAMKKFVLWAKDKNPQYMTYGQYANYDKSFFKTRINP